MAESAGEGAYSGLRVLDFTHVVAGPMCTRLLADHGAEVIKVEAPSGDMIRRFPHSLGEGMSTQFVQYNCGKRSVVIDLRDERGQGLARRLAGTADVLVENFRPGVMARLGLPTDRLRRDNPRLIICSISTFGQNNPLSSTPGFGFVAEAHSGLMSLGSDDRDPPSSFGTALSDMTVATHAFGAIGAALYRRERTGEGCAIDIASYETMVATIDHALVLHNFTRGEKRFKGYSRRHPVIVPNGVVVAADGSSVAYGVTDDRQFADLCTLIGRPELVGDPRYATGVARGLMPVEVYEMIEEWALTVLDGQALVDLFTGIRIPAARVRDYREVAEDPHNVRRGILAPIDYPGHGEVMIPVTPHHLDNASVAVGGLPPTLGQHTRGILGEDLGLSEQTIDALLADRVVAVSDAPGAAAVPTTRSRV